MNAAVDVGPFPGPDALDTRAALRELGAALGDAHALLMLATGDPHRDLGTSIEEGREGAAVRAAVRLLEQADAVLRAYVPEDSSRASGYLFDTLPEALVHGGPPRRWRSIPVELVSACVNRARSPLQLLLLDGVAADADPAALAGTIWGAGAWIEYALEVLGGVRVGDADAPAAARIEAPAPETAT